MFTAQETTTQNAFEGFHNNPFADMGAEFLQSFKTIEEERPTEKRGIDKMSAMKEAIIQCTADYKAENIKRKEEQREKITSAADEVHRVTNSLVSNISKIVKSVVSAVFKTVVSTVKQSFSMAIFKFAIEFCALSIKNLVESMISKNINPPNIDTTGVFYNLKNPTTGTTNQQTYQNTNISNTRSSYDNPFGSPFSMPAGW